MSVSAELNDELVYRFSDIKSDLDWINGGFIVV